MTKFYNTVILLCLVHLAGAQIWTQDFETNGLGITYTSASVFTANLNGHYNRTNGTNISNTVAPYSGMHGTFFWAGENLNIPTGGGDGLNTKTITFAPIAVTGQSNLEFRGLFGTGNQGGGWDFTDILYVEYKMDAGPWVKLMQFAANAPLQDVGLYHDTNLDGIGEGVALSSALSQFTASIPVTGLSLQFRIFSQCTAQGEEFAFDYLRLYSTTTAVSGCTDPLATNFSAAATVNNGSCTYSGCTNPSAYNYNPAATIDNGSCITSLPDITINEIHYNPNDNLGFTDILYEFIEIRNNTSAAVNIGNWRLSDAVDCVFPVNTTIAANGYVVVAATPATFPSVGQVFAFSDDLSNAGETIRLYHSANIQVDAVTYFPGSCWPQEADGHGPSLELSNFILDNNDPGNYCTGTANNGTPGAVNSCYSSVITGCTNPLATNYNPVANTDDGSCLIPGCTYAGAVNYSPSATLDDGSCNFPVLIYGCTDSNALNYDPSATNDDGSCIYTLPIPGCTYNSATNYNSNATTDDGSCIFTIVQTCPSDINGDSFVGVSDLLIFIADFGLTCP